MNKFLRIAEIEPGWNEQFRDRIRDAERRFQEMPEEDQILHLLSRKLGAVREFSKDYDELLLNAHRFISHDYGPRFADRILSDPDALKKLHLDQESFKPPPEGTTTVVVQNP